MNSYQSAVAVATRVNEQLNTGRITITDAHSRLLGAYQITLLQEGTGSVAGEFLDAAMMAIHSAVMGEVAA